MKSFISTSLHKAVTFMTVTLRPNALQPRLLAYFTLIQRGARSGEIEESYIITRATFDVRSLSASGNCIVALLTWPPPLARESFYSPAKSKDASVIDSFCVA